MAPRKLFGSLNLEGNVGPGENPNGVVAQTSNGTNINGKGSDGDDFVWGIPADGPRWNKTGPRGGKMEDLDVPRPVITLVNRRR
jgi:hypothetical protein